MSICHGHFWCPEILIPFGVSLSSLLKHAWQNASWMAVDAHEWTHVLMINTLCLHLHRFCTTGSSSSLATRVTFTPVPCKRLGESNTQGWTCLWFYFCIVVHGCCCVAFLTWCTLYLAMYWIEVPIAVTSTAKFTVIRNNFIMFNFIHTTQRGHSSHVSY
jgi:hypothetical protein